MRVIMNLNFQAQFFNYCCFYAYSKLRFFGAKIQIHNFEFFDSIWNFLTVWGGYENFEHCDAMTLMQEL